MDAFRFGFVFGGSITLGEERTLDTRVTFWHTGPRLMKSARRLYLPSEKQTPLSGNFVQQTDQSPYIHHQSAAPTEKNDWLLRIYFIIYHPCTFFWTDSPHPLHNQHTHNKSSSSSLLTPRPNMTTSTTSDMPATLGDINALAADMDTFWLMFGAILVFCEYLDHLSHMDHLISASLPGGIFFDAAPQGRPAVFPSPALEEIRPVMG